MQQDLYEIEVNNLMTPHKKIDMSLALLKSKEIEKESTNIRQVSVIRANDRHEVNEYNSYGGENQNAVQRSVPKIGPKHMTRAEVKLEAVRVSIRSIFIARNLLKNVAMKIIIHYVNVLLNLGRVRRLIFTLILFVYFQ